MTDRGRVSLDGVQGAQVGDHNTQKNYFVLPQAEVSWPVRVGPIPLMAGCYQERDETRLLSDAVTDGTTAVVTQVLSGLGGVGKTQLAAAYARTRTDADLLIWITAGSRDAILTGYAQATAQLGHPSADDTEQAARRLLAWLQATTERSWLIVLDDLADPADLRGLWPDGPRGHTVITTRRTDTALTGPGRRRIDVGLFTPDQARAYLAEKLDTYPDDERMRDADQLAADLGYLPLALAQAGAFILDRGDTCTRYRARLSDRRRRLAELFPPDALADDYHNTVAATWSISIDAADALPPAGLARPVLELLSVLDPNGIPTDLLTTDAAIIHASHRAIAPRDGQDLLDALHNLARLSLVTLESAGDATGVRVHGLVQRATVEYLDPDLLTPLHFAAATGLLAIWPEIERDTQLGQVLRANATNLIARAGASLWHGEAHPLLWRTGTSLGVSGLVDAAIRYSTQLVSDAHHHLGPEHPDILAAHAFLARWRGEAGDAAGAATTLEQLLGDLHRRMGPDHPHTLATRANLAHWRGEAGDPVGAASALEQLLADRLRLLGPDHPDTLSTRHNLAAWHGDAGDAAGAAAAFEQLLIDRLRVLGPDHPATLTTRHNLAAWQGVAGNPAGAVTALEQLLTDRLRVTGRDHPDTLTTRYALAFWRGEAGDLAGAITDLELLVTDQRRVLGPEHPHILITRAELARRRSNSGDQGGAARALEQLLTDEQRILGPDHPETLATRLNLAHRRDEAGDPAGAAGDYQQLLIDQRRVLGSDHPATLTTRHNLAACRGKIGDPADAVTALEQLLTDRCRVLGPDNPHTLITRATLASWKGEAGDPAGAVTALEQLLADRLRLLGPEHPDTLVTRHMLAAWRSKAGDPAGAAAAFEQLLTDAQLVLGSDHPLIVKTRNKLADLRAMASRPRGSSAPLGDARSDRGDD